MRTRGSQLARQTRPRVLGAHPMRASSARSAGASTGSVHRDRRPVRDLWPGFVGALLAASFAMALSAAPASATTPGYERVPVNAAGISLLVPEDWTVTRMTRHQAKAILKN